MNDLFNVLLQQALPIIATLFSGILTILSGFLINYIDTKIKNTKLNQAAKIAEETVYNVVLALEQTLVGEFMKANEDGKLTEEEKAIIKREALKSIHAQLQPQVKTALEFGYANLDEYIDKLLERMVLTETE